MSDLNEMQMQIDELQQRVNELQQYTIQGEGTLIGHGQRVDLDISIHLSELLSRIEANETAIATGGGGGGGGSSLSGTVNRVVKFTTSTTGGDSNISDDGSMVTVASGLTVSSIPNAITDTDRFLVSDGGVIKYRTGSELASDIGAPTGSGTLNTILKWTPDGFTAGDSSMVDDGSTISTPSAFSITSDETKLTIGASGDSSLRWGTVLSSDHLIIDGSETSADSGVLIKSPLIVSFNSEFFPSRQIGIHSFNTITDPTLPAYTGLRSLAVLNPSSASTTNFFGIAGFGIVQGTNDVGTMNAIFSSNIIQGSGDMAAINGVNVTVNTTTSTRTVSGDVSMLYFNALGNAISVTGDVYQARFADLSTVFTAGGTYYGILQEGTTATNEFNSPTTINNNFFVNGRQEIVDITTAGAVDFLRLQTRALSIGDESRIVWDNSVGDELGSIKYSARSTGNTIDIADEDDTTILAVGIVGNPKGYTGIRTTNPDTYLHLYDVTTAGQVDFLKLQTKATAVGDRSRIVWTNNTNVELGALRYGAESTGNFLEITDQDGDKVLSAGIVGSVKGNVFIPNGSLGVGPSSPLNLLHVSTASSGQNLVNLEDSNGSIILRKSSSGLHVRKNDLATDIVRFQEDGEVYAGLITADTDNSVVILNSSGYLKTDEINQLVWDTSLNFVSVTSGGANNRIPVFTGSNTVDGDADFNFDGEALGIGVIPYNGWGAAAYYAIQLHTKGVISSGSNDLTSGHNYYWNFGLGDYAYLTNGGSAQVVSVDSALNLKVADSGTIDTAITYVTAIKAETTRVTINPGLLGVGVTPSSWDSTYKAIQIGSTNSGSLSVENANGHIHLGVNQYYDSVDSRWEYVGTNGVTEIFQNTNSFTFRVANTGVANTAIPYEDIMIVGANVTINPNGDNFDFRIQDGSGSRLLDADAAFSKVNIGFNNSPPPAPGKFNVRDTATQMTLQYDSSNYASHTITPAGLYNISPTGEAVGINTNPDRPFHALIDDATNSGISWVGRFTHTTTGTPAAGIGAGIELEVKDAPSTDRVGSRYWTSYVTTDELVNYKAGIDVTVGSIITGFEIGRTTNGSDDVWNAELGDIASGDVSQIESDGTLVFLGNARIWNDYNSGGFPSSASNREDFKDSTGADTGIQTYVVDEGDTISGSFELEHDYDEGTDFYFHIHWQGRDATTGTDHVKYELTYTVGVKDAAPAASTTISVETSYANDYYFKVSEFPAISGTSRKIGDQFLFKVERVSPSGAAYSGKVCIATVGIHAMLDTVGSRQRFIK